MNRFRKNKWAAQAGFTLVEMMVAIVIASIMAIALIGTFIIQSRAYQSTREIQQMQQNARTTLDTLSQLLAQAGLGITSATPVPPNTTAGQAAFDFNDSCPACGPNGSAELIFAERDPSQLGWVKNINLNTNSLTFTYVSVPNVPPFTLSNGSAVFLLDQQNTYHAILTAQGTPVTSTTGSQVTVNMNFSSTPSFYNEITATTLNQSSLSTGTIMPVNVYKVYIDNTDPSNPALMMQINGFTTIPLAQGISNFQVSFQYSNPLITTPYPWPDPTQYVTDPTTINPANIIAILLGLTAQTNQFMGVSATATSVTREYTLTVNLPNLIPWKNILYNSQAFKGGM